jgi:hypothetical protein
MEHVRPLDSAFALRVMSLILLLRPSSVHLALRVFSKRKAATALAGLFTWGLCEADDDFQLVL